MAGPELNGRGRTVELLDFDGTCRVEDIERLLARLRSVRRGVDGAFILSHDRKASLWVHIHEDVAFLCYFPDNEGRHPGFVPDGMWAGAQREVRFRLVGGGESDSISVAWWQLLPVEAAYRAATEYLQSPSRPPSVTWFDLSGR
jgi:hypothetical protein